MRRKYPLEPLLRVRNERVERRAVEHGAALSQGEQKASVAGAARGRREHAEQAAASVQKREREHLTGGGARALDLQQAERHRAGAAERLRELTQREADAESHARAAREATERARAALAEAHAAERAVERHAGRFRAAVKRVAEQAEEEAAADYAASRRPGARRG
jgi:hypothetical protein